MFNMGMPEMMLIFAVALLVFGPKKLPEIGKSLGRAMHEFKKSTNEFKNKLESEVGAAEMKEGFRKVEEATATINDNTKASHVG